MEKVGSRPYVVVYFNADADLAIIPEPSFFLDAHSALAPSHRRQLKVCSDLYSAGLHMAYTIHIGLYSAGLCGYL